MPFNLSFNSLLEVDLKRVLKLIPGKLREKLSPPQLWRQNITREA
jgi:hypothetical protein